MFAYNPTVNDNSGQILGASQANAAATRAQGMQNFGQSIGDGLAAMGSGIAGGMTKARENAIKYDTAAGMLETYKQNANSLGLDLAMLDGLDQKLSKDPDKVIGALTVVGSIANNNLSMQRAQAQIDGYKDLYDYKSANSSSTPVVPDQPKYNSGEARAFAAQAKSQGLTDDQIREALRNTLGPWAENAVYGQNGMSLFSP